MAIVEPVTPVPPVVQAVSSGVGAPLRVPVWWALLLAVLSGVAQWVAFPPVDLWFLAPVGVALLAVAAHRRGVLAGAGLGIVSGIVFFVPLLSWANVRIGAVWLLLPLFECLYLGLLGAAAALLSPLVDRWRWSWPLLTGSLWVAQEALRGRAPFGGFPWGRLAFSQADGPLLRLAGLGGAPLVTFAVATAGGLLAAAAWGLWRRDSGPSLRRRAALTAAAVLVVLSGHAAPVTAARGPAVTVAIVQGNVPRIGLDFNAQRRAVLDNHVKATLDLADRVRTGQARRPDFVVWPENSSDIDPLRNADAAATISDAATAINAPILVGAVLTSEDTDTVRNAGLVWLPGTGPTQSYTKRHPVPFAEYVPLRTVARAVTSAVDMVPRDFVGGDRPGVLRLGPATIGDVICFEVAYDGLVRDTVTGGAQLLAVQTNNATFTETEARQQLAMVRLRAVEHGRVGLMASTVGVSGFVGTDGQVTGATRFFTPAVVVATVPLDGRRTLATRLGAAPEYVIVAVALLGLVAAGWLRRTGGRRRHDPAPPAPTS